MTRTDVTLQRDGSLRGVTGLAEFEDGRVVPVAILDSDWQRAIGTQSVPEDSPIAKHAAAIGVMEAPEWPAVSANGIDHRRVDSEQLRRAARALGSL